MSPTRAFLALRSLVVVFILFHVFVVAYEEPALASQFGESYRDYRRAVPRWGFTFRPFTTPSRDHLHSKEDA